ncbi:MAG TPA: DUF2752 domain-containing protein [Verrucomicrobiae bacterium]|nr:DUF2752 domain-containing protein [Verrucomicrobiae bacterium]
MVTHRTQVLGTAAIVTVIAAVIFVFDPTHIGIFPPCPLHQMTGLWCPGCGSTRALHELLHGHLLMAFRFNPLAISLLPLVGYLVLRRGHVTMRPVWIWTLLITVVMFGILRNIPVYPLTMLAP